MSWHNGALLWLLLVLPLLAGALIAAAFWRRRASERLGPTARQMVTGRSAGWRAARAVLLLLGLAAALIALARPQYGSREKLLSKRGVDVVVAMDFSKSMLAEDVKPSRIERAKAELMAFLSELGGDRVGLVAFAGETMEFPMTIDYSALALFFRDLRPADMPVGGTAIGRALTAGKRLLERANREHEEIDPEARRAKVVILLTDGEDHVGDPVEAAQGLAEIGARVFVVAIGSRSGETIPTYAEDGTWTGYLTDDEGKQVLTRMTKEAEATLRRVADITEGKFIKARRGSVGMEAVRAEMRRMKQTELKARKVTVHEERYALVLLVAFLLIVLEALLPEAHFPRRARETGGSA